MEKNTFYLTSMINDVKDYPMTNATEEVYNSIIKLGHIDLIQLFVALLGEDIQHLQISRDWNSGETHEQYMTSKPTINVVSCPRIMAQDALDQQAWEEECERQRDYYGETV
jgi:hypothetical protein